MKKLLLSLSLFFSLNLNAQTLIEYDYMESFSTTYSFGGWAIGAASAGWFTNVSVSPNLSAAIYGLGAGTSAYELDWYVLPNVILDPTRQYQLKFNLASYTFSNPTATTRGVDAGDYVEVQVSTNGGASYISELRITGNNNARWDYIATGAINHTANGSFTNSAAPAGDVYAPPAGVSTTGPSVVRLNLPTGISQVAIDLFIRANAAGEEWWFDNIELWDITPIALPVELISFEGNNTNQGNVLIWKTASEHNSSYFLVEHSTTGEFTEHGVIGHKPAAGHSTETLTYTFMDNNFSSTVNYYQITQVDSDGQFKTYGPITIDNSTQSKTRIKLINSVGQEVNEVTTPGMYLEVYDDGTSKRIWK